MLGWILTFVAVVIFITGIMEDTVHNNRRMDRLLAEQKCLQKALAEIQSAKLEKTQSSRPDPSPLEDPSPSYREGLKTLAWPCNCSRCTFIEKEYLADTTWPDHLRLPHDCWCEYTIRGRRDEYVARYLCDADWFRRRYCILPIPRGPSLFYYDPTNVRGTVGKTRLGRMVAHGSRCESGYACNAMLHYSWVDDVFNCESS